MRMLLIDLSCALVLVLIVEILAKLLPGNGFA